MLGGGVTGELASQYTLYIYPRLGLGLGARARARLRAIGLGLLGRGEIQDFCVSLSDNPVTAPNVEELCFHDSTNIQFQYETKEKLDSQLRMEYGNVSIANQLWATIV